MVAEAEQTRADDGRVQGEAGAIGGDRRVGAEARVGRRDPAAWLRASWPGVTDGRGRRSPASGTTSPVEHHGLTPCCRPLLST